jgi:hypothetical protein
LMSHANLEECKPKELYQLNLHTSLPNRNGGVRKSLLMSHANLEKCKPKERETSAIKVRLLSVHVPSSS